VRDINIVPERRKKEKVNVNNRVTTLLFIVAVILLLLYLVVFPIATSRSLEATYREFQIKAQEMSLLNQEVESLRTNIALESSRLELLKGTVVMDRSVDYILSNIKGSTPIGTHIKTLNYNEESITISGQSISPIDIADFLVVLRKTEIFTSVRVFNVTKGEEGVYEFNIGLKVNGGEENLN